jgi:hypothetical protein
MEEAMEVLFVRHVKLLTEKDHQGYPFLFP